MPDAWEARQGLDPRNPQDRNGVSADGYTNLEHYLSERAGDGGDGGRDLRRDVGEEEAAAFEPPAGRVSRGAG
ncbi:MAG: hypothetical protein KJS77_02295 [Planctomycetes bacterium]|nr:hypothetical protein [Planctomycetota bacterium]